MKFKELQTQLIASGSGKVPPLANTETDEFIKKLLQKNYRLEHEKNEASQRADAAEKRLFSKASNKLQSSRVQVQLDDQITAV